MASTTHEPLTTNGDDWKTGPGNLRYQVRVRSLLDPFGRVRVSHAAVLPQSKAEVHICPYCAPPRRAPRGARSKAHFVHLRCLCSRRRARAGCGLRASRCHSVKLAVRHPVSVILREGHSVNVAVQGLLRDQPKPAGVKSADWRRACRLADGVTRSRAALAADCAARSHAPASAARTPPSKCAVVTPTPAWPRHIVWPASWADDDDSDFDSAVAAKLPPAESDAAGSPRIGAIAAPRHATPEAAAAEAAAPDSPALCIPAQRSPFGRAPEPAAATRTQKRRERRTRVVARCRDDGCAALGAATLDGSCSGSQGSANACAAAEQPSPMVSAARLTLGADGAVVTTPGQALMARLAPNLQQPATAAQVQWLNATAANASYAQYIECELATGVPPAGLAAWYSLPASEQAAGQVSSTVVVRLAPPAWTSEQLSASSAVLRQRYDVMSRLPPGGLGPMPCQTRLVFRWGVPFWQLAGVAQQRARAVVGSTA